MNVFVSLKSIEDCLKIVKISSKISGRKSNSFVSSALISESTAGRTSGFPKRPLEDVGKSADGLKTGFLALDEHVSIQPSSLTRFQ